MHIWRTNSNNTYFIVSNVEGEVTAVMVQANLRVNKDDVLYTI